MDAFPWAIVILVGLIVLFVSFLGTWKMIGAIVCMLFMLSPSVIVLYVGFSIGTYYGGPKGGSIVLISTYGAMLLPLRWFNSSPYEKATAFLDKVFLEDQTNKK